MAQIFRGILNSEYVYWDNINTFMPEGTQILTGQVQENNNEIISSVQNILDNKKNYQIPNKKINANYRFDSDNRDGLDLSGNDYNLICNQTISEQSIIPCYNNILTSTLTAIYCNKTINWNSRDISFCKLFNSNRKFCIELIFRLETLPDNFWYCLLGNNTNFTINTLYSYINSSDKTLQYNTNFIDLNTNNNITANVSSKEGLEANKWYHVVLQSFFDIDNNIISQIFINGILSGESKIQATNSFVINDSSPLYIGNSNTTSDIPDISINSLKIYGDIMTSNDVELLFQNSFIGQLQ